MANKLGQLIKVELRDVWKHEAIHFTRWLAQENNIAILSEEISIEFENVQENAQSGRFNVDILADEITTGKKIIIENQLEMTDHKHLGQLITYASGHNAEIIIWIVDNYRDEHKQAIDWLNNSLGEKTSFFLVQVELWQIGKSPVAPKFNVISQPNNWANIVKVPSEISELKLMQQEFWENFKEYTTKNKTSLRVGRKARPQHWFNLNYGTAMAHISLTVNSKNQLLGVEIYIRDSKKLYKHYQNNKTKIQKELGFKLDWQDLPDKKAFRILVSKSADFYKTEKWDEYFKWLKATAEKFAKVFKNHLPRG